MAPITKDSDTLLAPGTAPESTGRSGTGGVAPAESAVKAQPVALEIPITVNGVRTAEGSDKREPFSESTKTVMVFGSGTVIRMNSAMTPGQLLFLTNERTKKEVVCQVVKSKNYRAASGYVELEFTEPAVGFWGMRFPGDRIGPGPQAAPAEARTTTAEKPVPVAARPATPKTEPTTSSGAPSTGVNVAKPAAPAPSAPAPSVAKPAAPVTSNSSVVPRANNSPSSLGTPEAKADASAPATPAPIATTLGADTPLVEPWLKKREPAPRVPAATPSAAPSAPSAKKEKAESSLTPARSFAVERPSDKPASLFAPAEAPANLASVDLSSITPFFEVKPVVADAPAAPAKAPAANDAEMEELKQHTARLQDELGKMQFAETDSSSTAKAEAKKVETKKSEAKKPETEKASAPEMEISAFPLTEQSIETLKTELVHENAVRLVEDPEPANTTPVLPELAKLDEPVKVETPAVISPASATIPALESLEQEEMKIPAWLAPLARNSSAPASTQELVLREKTKRRAEQPQLQELVAPLAKPAEEKRAGESRVPQFGTALPFEEPKTARQGAPRKSGKGMMLGGIAAGILVLAGGGWWYMNQRASGTGMGAATAGSIASSSPQDLQTSAMKESVLGTTPSHQTDPTVSAAKATAVDPNATSNSASSVSSASRASAARLPQGGSNGLNGGNVVTKGESAEPEAVHEVEKKPALGQVHLEAPKISQKRTMQAGAAPDAGILSEEQPGASADPGSLGGLAVASNQPAAPAAPIAVGGDVKQAKLISSVPPAYPAMAKAEHVSGAVTIDALIDANGRVTTMKVISGPALLQDAAKDALKQWKYQPAMLDGKAVPMHLTVTLQFRLQQ